MQLGSIETFQGDLWEQKEKLVLLKLLIFEIRCLRPDVAIPPNFQFDTKVFICFHNSTCSCNHLSFHLPNHIYPSILKSSRTKYIMGCVMKINTVQASLSKFLFRNAWLLILYLFLSSSLSNQWGVM